MTQLLDNIVWNTLIGPHEKYAVGNDAARRYAPGFSPMIGFADGDDPDFSEIEPYCEPGERFYCAGWSRSAPAGWLIDLDSVMVQMVWEGSIPDDEEALDAVPLGAEHSLRAMELAAMMRPGPFGPRTIELGDYFGWLEGDKLAAMAGERMYAGQFREVSGVATHPDYQGRGLARGLVLKLIRRQLQRGETPFLHVMRENFRAREIYRRMGFQDRREIVIRIVAQR